MDKISNKYDCLLRLMIILFRDLSECNFLKYEYKDMFQTWNFKSFPKQTHTTYSRFWNENLFSDRRKPIWPGLQPLRVNRFDLFTGFLRTPFGLMDRIRLLKWSIQIMISLWIKMICILNVSSFGKFIENGTEKKNIKMLCFENSTCSQTLHDNALRYFFEKFKFRIKLLLIHFGNL